jgi:putative transposase
MPDWAHSPSHRLGSSGTYMVTASTLQKVHIFKSRSKLDILQSILFESAGRHGAKLRAWAIFPNHYHFIAAFDAAPPLAIMLHELHANAARLVNDLDSTPQRRVWFQYWESHITFQRSYFARLQYVRQNAVHHRVVREATTYPWCSAGWFRRSATRAMQKTIGGFGSVKVGIEDNFEVVSVIEER